MKIEIKERKLTEGKRALYLEYYETGFRKRENLHLYLLPDDAVGAAKHNRLTYNKAMEIRAERILTPPVLEKENAKSEEQGNSLTWLQWCDDYIKWSVDCGNCKKMIGHKNVVRKRIATYLRRVDKKDILLKDVSKTSNPQPIGFSGILLAKRQNSFYCTYFLPNRNVADTKSPYPIKRLEVIRWFNQKSMVFNQSLS